MFKAIVDLQRDIYFAFVERIGNFAESGAWSQLALNVCS